MKWEEFTRKKNHANISALAINRKMKLQKLPKPRHRHSTLSHRTGAEAHALTPAVKTPSVTPSTTVRSASVRSTTRATPGLAASPSASTTWTAPRARRAFSCSALTRARVPVASTPTVASGTTRRSAPVRPATWATRTTGVPRPTPVRTGRVETLVFCGKGKRGIGDKKIADW